MVKRDCTTCEFNGGAVCMVDGKPIEKCMKKRKSCYDWGLSFPAWVALMEQE